jgi:hypothetical protein
LPMLSKWTTNKRTQRWQIANTNRTPNTSKQKIYATKSNNLSVQLIPYPFVPHTTPARSINVLWLLLLFALGSILR